MGKKGKILWLSDSPLTCTGYATITRNILNGLTDRGWECVQLCHNLTSQPLEPGITFSDGTKINFRMIGHGLEPYCVDIIEPIIKKEKPDIFGVLLDTFMLYPRVLNMDFSPARSIFYFPSDGGGGLPLGCDNILKKFNYSVAMSKFGQKQVLDVHGIKTDYIPHAIDPKIYFSMSDEEKKKLRKEMIVFNNSNVPIQGFLDGKFVIGIVARNQGRKMLDRTIKTFAKLALKYPDIVLFFHIDPDDGAQVFPMREMVKRYNLENRIVYSGMKFYNGFNYKDMHKVYNVMDVFFLSTSGEGFGIPTIEAMACEIPCVVTDYATTQELLIDNGVCGEAVPVTAEITGSWMVERGIMNDEEAAKRIENLYHNPELRKQYGKVGKEKVLRFYTWENILQQWDDYFTKMVQQ